jgi:hypothetical protein
MSAQQQAQLEEVVLKMEAMASTEQAEVRCPRTLSHCLYPPHEPSACTCMVELTESPLVQVLDGAWRLVLTSDLRTQSVIRAVSMLPLVSVGDIVQVINTGKEVVETRVSLAVPLRVDLSTVGTFKSKSARLTKSKLNKASMRNFVQAPELFPTMQVPAYVKVGNEKLDLTSIQGLTDGMQRMIQQALNFITQPEVEIEEGDAATWLNTVVRKDLRIVRGAGADIVVFVRTGVAGGSENKKT